MKYEYIGLKVDFGDLSSLNRYGSVGWHVAHVKDSGAGLSPYEVQVLLERRIPDGEDNDKEMDKTTEM